VEKPLQQPVPDSSLAEAGARRTLPLLGATLLAIATLTIIAAQRATQAQAPATRSVSDSALVAKGAALAAIGNCATCHTADGAKTLAGGRPIATPFGTIYSTNLTPDPDTGIGRWSAQEFRRAMHEGIGRDGRQLYPAFPYDHYTRVTNEDVDAIFAYLMARDPVRAVTPENRVLVPRPLVAGWKALYFKPGALQPDPAQDAQWNRGRYLSEGLGHCGACHTPRNALGAEEPERALAGGRIEGWSAPALNAQSPAPHPWTVEELTTYLRIGFDAQHGVAAGAMAAVTQNLSTVAEADVRAIAVYVAWQMREARARGPAAASAQSASEAGDIAEDAVADSFGASATGADGQAVYKSACAGCHERARRGIPLGLSTAVTDATSANLVRITFEGVAPREGRAGGIMPGFAGALTDRQMAALAEYLRREIGRAPAWTDVDREIAKARDEAKPKKSS
jgi:mono/diheme cytochrome c family protein